MSSASSIKARLVATYAAAGFLLNLAWELAQMPLFKTATDSFLEGFAMCLLATATGDMLFMLALYLTLVVVHRNPWWITEPHAYAHPATWIVTPLFGVLLASNFELWAIHVWGRWSYDTMPVVPLLGIGVTPLLQMIVVPLATLALCRWLVRRSETRRPE